MNACLRDDWSSDLTVERAMVAAYGRLRPRRADRPHPAHRFQNAAPEFRQFVQKQHAMMGQRNLSGCGIDVAAQQPCIARR